MDPYDTRQYNTWTITNCQGCTAALCPVNGRGDSRVDPRTFCAACGGTGRYAAYIATDDATGRIDEQWIKEWVAFGMDSLDKYLQRHAEFHQYLTERGMNDAC